MLTCVCCYVVQCANAKEVWLEMDLIDPLLVSCLWSEVCCVYIQCYINRQHEALVVFKPNHCIKAALNSLGSKCKPDSPEIGRTEINEVANEANVDKRQAFSAGDAVSSLPLFQH
ncbi:hypothetical protein EMCRGX_G002682 [Ephydatia muelleri]